MEERKLTCIGCPMGCPLTVVMNGKEVVSVTGNTCKRGDVYARKEVTDPTRIVTSTVRVSGGSIPMVSVKTKEDIPKDKIFECVRALKGIQVPAPVHIGDIILKNVADTGVDIVATKNVEYAVEDGFMLPFLQVRHLILKSPFLFCNQIPTFQDQENTQ